MSAGEIKNLGRPDESLTFEHGRAEWVVIGDLTVGRSIIQPGRAAVHTGEVELAGDDVGGVSVHEAARVLGMAGSGEVLVSAITRDLAAAAAGLSFEDRGEHDLKGLAGARRLFALDGRVRDPSAVSGRRYRRARDGSGCSWR